MKNIFRFMPVSLVCVLLCINTILLASSAFSASCKTDLYRSITVNGSTINEQIVLNYTVFYTKRMAIEFATMYNLMGNIIHDADDATYYVWDYLPKGLFTCINMD